jgi:PAS domain S-box-containing protein
MDKTRILIVDDDPSLRKTLGDILSLKGCETIAAENGMEGLKRLRETPVNLALIDIGLPDISGIEVLKRIKADSPATEAIILTGNATLDSAIEAANGDAFSYLVKPYGIEQLMLHIRRAIEKQQTESALRESEERYRRLVEYAPDAMLVHSEGVCHYANGAALRMFGAGGVEQLVGQTIVSIVHPDYRADAEKRMRQLEETEIASLGKEQKMVRFDGTSVDVEARGININYRGKPAVQVILRDITLRKRLQEELTEKVAQLEAALVKVKQLEGIIPICMYCKKIRDDRESWHQLESYITEHSEALFSHGICPECFEKAKSGI